MQYTSINRRKESVPVKRGMSKMSFTLKRFFDVVFSALGIVLLSPIFLLIYIALLLQGNGSVIYKQERVGLHGKSFNILKFRTMKKDAERNMIEQRNERSFLVLYHHKSQHRGFVVERRNDVTNELSPKYTALCLFRITLSWRKRRM